MFLFGPDTRLPGLAAAHQLNGCKSSVKDMGPGCPPKSAETRPLFPVENF
jgi:hypothetical protein